MDIEEGTEHMKQTFEKKKKDLTTEWSRPT